MNWKRNEGLTLVELMVAILVAAIITTAATTIMLLGLRVNRHSTNTAQTQYTARTVLTVLENLASEGTIASVESTPESWKVFSAEKVSETEYKVLLSYSAEDKTIYTGTTAPLLENVVASNVVFKDGLLTFAIETTEGSYTSSVFCRTTTQVDKEVDTSINIPDENNSKTAREAFLNILLSQYDSVGGVIQGDSEYTFFSEWYIKSREGADAWGDNNWNYRTPWCACFISWALAHKDVRGSISAPTGRSYWYANVEEFRGYFPTDLPTTPTPGDLIFFDWEKDGSLDHIGAVLRTEGDTVFTIEGNSANTVAIRKYDKSDERIAGYGVLPWSN